MARCVETVNTLFTYYHSTATKCCCERMLTTYTVSTKKTKTDNFSMT